ncbi:class I SAM-dependent methyltransferase [Pedobacter caeni]|uniref:Ubiquinone/menaquinone biosynthesis C-methylase UbiE n=1 Tax=Pedobacter caeni TaxID=288992 RepID=A0A1M5HVB4_9SPHI|nr:class I SAM-dependent methyltransferase [Pedobacter caeni]SHG19875.1 Ubiquinone/menaquinone biosynthesis C-methylase UbiE [Pedobacter caeni]
MDLYHQTGLTYNKTRAADPLIKQRLIALINPKNGKDILDVGCGTGNYTIELSRAGLNMYGTDPSDQMLRIAAENSDPVAWKKGYAEKIDFAGDTFDGAIATLTIHHWIDLAQSLKELYRVLKPGSNLVIFSATSEQMRNYWLHHYFPKMMAAAMNQMPSFSKIWEYGTDAGFEVVKTEKYVVHDELQDLFLYAGKRKPEMYLDPEIREGISSFTDLSAADEISSGLTLLERDIKSKKINIILDKFDDRMGDYLFMVLSKPEQP